MGWQCTLAHHTNEFKNQIRLLYILDLLQKSLTAHPQPLPACGYGVHTSLYKTKIVEDPPKSPLKRGTLTLVPPFLRGVRGDLNAVRQLSKTCVYTVAACGEGRQSVALAGWGSFLFLIYARGLLS